MNNLKLKLQSYSVTNNFSTLNNSNKILSNSPSFTRYLLLQKITNNKNFIFHIFKMLAV